MNRQRLDSPLVYIGAHNVYDVKEMLRFGDRHDRRI